MNARARCLRTIAISSLVALWGCAHGAPAVAPDPIAPGESAVGEVISFREDPDCCQRTTRRYAPDAETPFGPSVQSRLEALGALRCPVESSDGSRTHYEVRVSQPGEVTVDQAATTAEGCGSCFSQLYFEARIQLRSLDDRLTFDQRTTLRELSPGDGYVFQVADGEVAVRGLFGREGTFLRTFRFEAGETHGDPLAEVSGDCASGD